MLLRLVTTVFLISASASSSLAQSRVSDCSLPSRELVECTTAEGDVFTYFNRPGCLHEKLQLGSGSSSMIASSKSEDPSATKFNFKGKTVNLPKEVVSEVARISATSYRQQEILWDGIDDKVERNNKMVAKFAEYRAKSVAGAVLFELDSMNNVLAAKPMSCRMPQSHF